MKKCTWRIAGINFDHFHMGDLLRYAHEHLNAEIVGISDEQPVRMEEAIRKGLVAREKAFIENRECLEKTRPDVVILCPAASRHREWVKKVASHGAHLLVEKPFAASLKEADAMVASMAPGQTLMINWPLQWVGSQRKAHELVADRNVVTAISQRVLGGRRSGVSSPHRRSGEAQDRRVAVSRVELPAGKSGVHFPPDSRLASSKWA